MRLLIICGIAALLVSCSRPAPLSPELTTPKLALEAIRPELRERPLFSTSDQELTPFPQAWRALDRKERFGSVLLAGDPARFRPLLDHLRRAHDFTLTRVDPTSYFFERNPTKTEVWTTASIPSVLEAYPAKEQQLARVQLAHRLIYLDELPAAKALLDEVLKQTPESPEAWTQMAAWHGSAGQWSAALHAANRALAAKRNYRPAQVAKAQALEAQGQFDDALILTRALYAATPDDPQILFLYAKVAHSAHAYQEEILVMKSLIALLQKHAQPVGNWQIFLGQAHSAVGETRQAAEQFQAALKDPSLGEAQRAFATKALERFGVNTSAISN